MSCNDFLKLVVTCANRQPYLKLEDENTKRPHLLHKVQKHCWMTQDVHILEESFLTREVTIFWSAFLIFNDLHEKKFV